MHRQQKNLCFILFFFFISLKTIACTCITGDQEYYSLYKNDTLSFVGKVISEDSEKFRIEVINNLRTKLKDTIDLYNHRPCAKHLDIGKTYLIRPYYSENKLNISKCSYVKVSTDPEFADDTATINLFAKKDTFINSRLFKGQIKNGMRQGIWEYYTGDLYTDKGIGKYKKDKKTGKWRNEDSICYYIHGHRIWKRYKKIATATNSG